MALNNFTLSDVGGIFTSLREALTGEKIKDPLEVLKQINTLETAYLKSASDVIVAEAKSKYELAAIWRPITMLVLVFIIANNYIIAPYAMALFSAEIPTLVLTPEIWEIVKLGLGGYIIGRSAEKVAKNWKQQ